MKRLAIVLVLAVAGTMAPARAVTHVVILGTAAPAGGGCFMAIKADDRRQTYNFAPATPPLPTGACDENTFHHHLVIACYDFVLPSGPVATESDPLEIYMKAVGQLSNTFYIKIVDRGAGTDEFGWTKKEPLAPDRCGASEVVSQPVLDGNLITLVTE